MADENDTAAAEAGSELRDAEGALRGEVVAAAAEAIEHGDAETLRALAGEMHEADLGDLIEALPPDTRPRLIALMGSDFDFTALTQVDDAIREEILEELPPEAVAAGVRELDSDDAVYLLEDLPREDQEEILQKLPAPERVALERSLFYPEDSAGRRMQTEFIAVPPFWTVGQTIDYMRETPDLPDRFFEIYVVDPAYRLIGTVALDRILRTKRPVPISELVEPEHRKVRATDDQEAVARQFERYDMIAAPVVDGADRLVGVITIDDIVDVIEAEAEEDLKALGGVQAAEELSDSVLVTSRSRLPWLVINMGTAFIAAAVIAFFEATIDAVVAVAILMPVNSALGGNAGTQAMTVAVRAIATRELNRSNKGRVVTREFLVGLINGCVLALLAGAAAGLWFQSPTLGLVLAAAMVLTVVVATGLGILIPLALNRLKIDPAVASAVFVTTAADVFGFFTFLALATVAFGLL